jgi:hypothetical protein
VLRPTERRPVLHEFSRAKDCREIDDHRDGDLGVCYPRIADRFHTRSISFPSPSLSLDLVLQRACSVALSAKNRRKLNAPVDMGLVPGNHLYVHTGGLYC